MEFVTCRFQDCVYAHKIDKIKVTIQERALSEFLDYQLRILSEFVTTISDFFPSMFRLKARSISVLNTNTWDQDEFREFPSIIHIRTKFLKNIDN